MPLKHAIYTYVSGSKFDYQTENIFLPVSLSDMTVASSILDLTSKLKDSAIVSAIPLPKITSKINIFTSPGAEYEGTNSQIVYDSWNPVTTADEATELPPVIALPPEDLVSSAVSIFVEIFHIVGSYPILKNKKCLLIVLYIIQKRFFFSQN